MKTKLAIAFSALALIGLAEYAAVTTNPPVVRDLGTTASSALITTNISLLTAEGGTNTLYITNSLIRRISSP